MGGAWWWWLGGGGGGRGGVLCTCFLILSGMANGVDPDQTASSGAV